MRKINTILSAFLIGIFLLHGVLGGFMLLGIGHTAGKMLTWAGCAVLALHTAIGFCLTAETFRAGGTSYAKRNALFWARRGSGLAILFFLWFHIGAFGGFVGHTYILFPFTAAKLLAQLGLVASLGLHIWINIRPLLVSLGIISYKERRGDIELILSVLLVFMAGSVVAYYIGWQYL